ncbi:hypothetical protein DV738_g4189, partial [Chaetothyriales sp. CBS 135597]
MVDAATQYSPPKPAASPEPVVEPVLKPPVSNIESLQIQEPDPDINHPQRATTPPSRSKRQASDTDEDQPALPSQQQLPVSQAMDDSPVKKSRPDAPVAHIVPLEYEFCDTRDLVVLISSMIMELIRYNDSIPLKDGHLTRFHSRAPPGISVQDYLQRLTTHATLSPPILLSMVYYIDRLCALYPAFTITSLTVHRFLIASATVASKGLSDSFWTNKTYARVGGVSSGQKKRNPHISMCRRSLITSMSMARHYVDRRPRSPGLSSNTQLYVSHPQLDVTIGLRKLCDAIQTDSPGNLP